MSTTVRSAANTATARMDAPPESIGHFIDGRAIAGGSGRQSPVYDPATGQMRAQIALKVYGEDLNYGDLKKFAELTGRDEKTLSNYMSVSRKFEMSRRRDNPQVAA